MSNPQTRTLTEGSTARALAVVSAPMSLGILAVISVGLADAYFLGQLGQGPLAAVGFIFPVTTAITSLSIGLSAGANAVLSQSIGRARNNSAVQRAALQAIGLGTLLAAAVAAMLWLAYPTVFALMGADDAVLGHIGAYIPIWCASFPFLVAMMVGNAAFRAHGDGMRAAAIMVVAAIVNIGLDPILIFGMGPLPAFDVAGAAWATLVARALAMALALTWAWRRGLIGSCGNPLTDLARNTRELVKVGAPAAFSNAINPAGMALVTAAVATLGQAYVAGFGAATRVQALAIVPLLALSAGIGPVVGQNWGADKQDRARQALRQTFLICAGYGLLAGAGLFLFASPIAATIASGEEATRHAALYLKVVGWSLGGYGILVTANAAMNARSRALWSMSLSLARIVAIYLPLAWLGVWAFGYIGILGAAVIANLLAIWGAVIATRATGLLRFKMGRVAWPARVAASG